MNDQDYLDWAKERALEYLAAGDSTRAYTSLASDLNNHPTLRDHPAIPRGMKLLFAGRLDNVDWMRAFIEEIGVKTW